MVVAIRALKGDAAVGSGTECELLQRLSLFEFSARATGVPRFDAGPLARVSGGFRSRCGMTNGTTRASTQLPRGSDDVAAMTWQV